MNTKTHWKKVFNKDYLGACDFEDNKDIIAIIKAVEIREIKSAQGTEKRNVAVFTDPKIKPMILNVSNCKMVKAFSGSAYIEDWKNVAVQLYVKDDIKAFGEITDGVRIRPSQPRLTKPQLKKGTQQWDNAVKALKEGKTIEDIKKFYTFSAEIQEQLISEAV
jgi:hypothetical protein